MKPAPCNPDVERAIAIVGSPSGLARRIGVSKQEVNGWRKGTRPVPAIRCAALEVVTGGELRVEVMAPETEWIRDPETGAPVAYVVRVPPLPAPKPE